jgi:hypothetical protein
LQAAQVRLREAVAERFAAAAQQLAETRAQVLSYLKQHMKRDQHLARLCKLKWPMASPSLWQRRIECRLDICV